MPVDSPNTQYNDRLSQWRRCRDAVNGGDSVKGAGGTYLPVLDGQDTGEYDAYRMRALYYGASGRTVQGLLGAIFRKEGTLTLPAGVEDFERVTSDGLDVVELSQSTVEEVLTVGRQGILVDATPDGTLVYAAPYTAENIINWTVDPQAWGLQRLTQVVLRESAEVPDPQDPWVTKAVTQYRVLVLEEGRYVQRVFRKADKSDDWVQVEEDVRPVRSGIGLDHIPFVFINATNLSADVRKAPLLDLVDVNLSHYRTSADLEHGAHFTALPTAYVAGFPKSSKLRIGSRVAWVSDNPQAKAAFLEYTGQGLGALRDLKKDKEQLMAVLGARFLEEQKRAAEAAETLEIRGAGEHSALAAVARSVSNGLEWVLREIAWWRGDTAERSDELVYRLNTDFIATRMDPQELTALMKAWQGGGISIDTFLDNLKRGEILPQDRTVEDERDMIESEHGPVSRAEDEIPAPPRLVEGVQR